MKTLTLDEFRKFVDDRFGGVLEAGQHKENGKACVLESFSAAQGMDWTDDPKTLRTWDLRSLNDIPVSPAVRAKHIAPVLVAYQGSMNWPVSKQKRVSANLAILTVQKIISELPRLSSDLRWRCRQADTLKEAEAAGLAADAAARATAVKVAGAAAEAARAAAAAAARATAVKVAGAAAAAAARAAEAEAETAAAWAAAAEAETAAAWAAAAEWAAKAEAAEVADAAAWAVVAREKVFILACKIYLEAVSI